MKSKSVQLAWLVALLLGPVVLMLMPAGFFDEGVALCPSRLFFDAECPSCGMTRAAMHLLHFDLDSALYYNRGIVVVFPLLLVVWWIWVRDAAVLSGVWKKKEA